jgi:heavy metal translocating P-type ATPase
VSAAPADTLGNSAVMPTGAARVRRRRLFALPGMRWAVAALTLFASGLGARLSGAPAWAWWSLYLACYAAGGWEPALAGLRALSERRLDVDLLMVAAAIVAAAIGQVIDGALLIVIFAASGALEALAAARTEESVRGLLDCAPGTAVRLTPDGGEETVPVTVLAAGDVILVRPGERIGADGLVVAGASEVDQATVTGEPLPVDKRAGDQVFAGTLNGTGTLRVRAVRRAAESVVARIAALVEEAARTKAAMQLFIDKVEQRYSVGMVAATIALFAVPLAAGQPLRESLLRAMTFMIVASPCAVVLATMPPLLAVIANAGRRGVLVKSAVVMEQLGAATQVAFDKTGTLTRGVPEVTRVRVLPGAPFTEDGMLALAAAAEHPSEHPLAAAIVRAARERGLALADVTEFAALPGRGVTARAGGRLVEVGSPAALLYPRDPAPGMTAGPVRDVPEAAGGTGLPETGDAAREAAAAAEEMRAGGHTAVVVLCDHLPAGVLGIADQLRPEAPGAVAAAAALTSAAPMLVTGDHPVPAARLAARVGIADVRAGLLPGGKVAVVRQLQARGRRVTLVGDGLNDAPALAAADVGIAMGGAGAALSVQAAGAVVVRDDLTAVPALIALSRRARRVVAANLVIAAAFIAGLVLWDLAGRLPLPLGVAGHEGSTVLVGLNGLRLLRPAAWRDALRAGQSPRPARCGVGPGSRSRPRAA